MTEIFKKFTTFFKGQTVLAVSFAAAVISMFFYPPCRDYFSYINTSVIILLFCLMSAVAGLRNIGVFGKASSILITKAGSARSLGFIMMNLCFFSSMLLTNDVALITFVPLTIMIFEETNSKNDLAMTVVIETASANLGSMLTPLGNPQCLYIYARYKLGLTDFIVTMLPLSVASYLLLLIMLRFLSREKFTVKPRSTPPLPVKELTVYIVLFILCLLTVSRIISDYVCLAFTIPIIFLTNKKLLLKVDYALLMTFICFFIFSGNAGNIESVRTLVSNAVHNRELIVSAGLSQIISNVPAAVMLSEFTDKYKPLLMGVNIGGLGTPIASLASLISYKFYAKSGLAEKGKYLRLFSIFGFSMLAILLALAFLITKK